MDAIEAAALRKAVEAGALREAVACIDRHAKGAEADAGFDAGEFSGPAHGRQQVADLAAIAARHGITPDQLDDLLLEWGDTPGDDACSCGARPGDGITEGCNDPDGCGYWRAVR
jgi:hypothetical protein